VEKQSVLVLFQKLLNKMVLLPHSQKLQINIQAFDYVILNQFYKKVIKALESTECKINGPIFLPTKKKVYCLLRSPHVDKNSREHFEIRSYKRVIEIYYNPSINIIKRLIDLNSPSGIFYKIKIKSL
jgi:small subunit ribosomal protein S10